LKYRRLDVVRLGVLKGNYFNLAFARDGDKSIYWLAGNVDRRITAASYAPKPHFFGDVYELDSSVETYAFWQIYELINRGSRMYVASNLSGSESLL